MRRAALLATSLMLAGTLSACGGNDVEAYCDQITQSQDLLEQSSDPTAFGKVSEEFDNLADVAPEEIATEWQTLAEGIGQIQQAISDSGLSEQELQQVAENPAQVDPAKLQKLQEAGQEIEEKFADPKYDKAGDTISTYTEENCGVEPFSGS